MIDLVAGSVLAATPVPESVHRAGEPNPRGGVRGAKGVGVWGDRVVVANAERLFVLDRGWSVIGEITHPWMGGVHDILCEESGIAVACADSELILEVDWVGEVRGRWCWRDDRGLRRTLDFPNLPFDPDRDYRDPSTTHGGVWNVVHLNGVARAGEDLIASFGRILPRRYVHWMRAKAAVVHAADRVGLAEPAVLLARKRRARRIDREQTPVERVPGAGSALVSVRTGEILLRARTPAGVPNHNVLVVDGSFVYNDSNTGELVRRNRRDGDELRVRIPGSPPFARGLARLDETRYLVGSQRPAAVHVIDHAERRVVRSIGLGGLARETVFGISVLPDQFHDPPQTLLFAS